MNRKGFEKLQDFFVPYDEEVTIAPEPNLDEQVRFISITIDPLRLPGEILHLLDTAGFLQNTGSTIVSEHPVLRVITATESCLTFEDINC